MHISRKYIREVHQEKTKCAHIQEIQCRKYTSEKTEETSTKYAIKIHCRKYTREIHHQEKLNMFTSRKYQASGISYQTLVEGSEIFPRSKESCDEEKMFYILSDI